jgi:tetratricopeptide (TPR) repeat protein
VFFARLGVFVGGCTLEAAEGVLRTEGRGLSDGTTDSVLSPQSSVLDGLAALVDQSLLRQDEGADGEPRFWMLETIREYARERLAASGEEEAIRQAHAAYYLALAEAAEPELRGLQEERCHQRLAAESDNLHATLGWYREHGEIEQFARVGAALWRFWWMTDYSSAGRRWVDQVLVDRAALPAALRARTLLGAARLMAGHSDFAKAHMLLDECLPLFRDHHDVQGIADTLAGYVFVAYGESDYARTQALVTECLRLFQQLDDKPQIAWAMGVLAEVLNIRGELASAQAILEQCLALVRQLDMKAGIADALVGIGAITVARGEYARAVSPLEEGLALYQEMGITYGISSALNYLGQVSYGLGDYERAAALFAESLALRRRVGERRGCVPMLTSQAEALLAQGDVARAHALSCEALTLACDLNYKQGVVWGIREVASTAAVAGQLERAARLWGAEEALREAAGLPIWPDERHMYEHALAAAHTQLDEATFAAAWAAGRAMPLEQAIDYALEDAPPLEQSRETPPV